MCSLRLFPISKIGGRLTVRKIPQRSLEYLCPNPLGHILLMLLRGNTNLLETMMTSTRDGSQCVKRGTKQCHPYLANKARYSRIHVARSFKIPQWSKQVHPNINGFSGHVLTRSWLSIRCQKSSKNLSRGRSQSQVMQIHHKESMLKEIPTHKIKDKTRVTNLWTSYSSHKKIRVMERQRKTLESGASSIKSSGTTLMNVARSNYQWLS